MTSLPGELLYEYTLQLGEITEYGASLEDIASGWAEPPATGLRVDLPFTGRASGRLAGEIRGVDYLNVRADGRMELDLRATVVTPEGVPIALAADGVAVPRPGSPLMELRENVTLRSASPDHAWLNRLQVWAVGEADMSTGRVTIRGYLV